MTDSELKALAERWKMPNAGIRAPTDGLASRGLADAILAVIRERDEARAALIARHGGEPVALLAELDEARSKAGALAGALDFFWDAVAAEDAERIQAECDCASEACHHQVTVAFDRARAALEAWRMP